ncbi:hypothetical protein ABPG72_012088 [Tetrahymena utriculariae]
MKTACYRNVSESNTSDTSKQQVILIYSRCNIKMIDGDIIEEKKESAQVQYSHYLDNFDKYRIFLPKNYHIHIQHKKFPYFLSVQQSQENQEHIDQVLQFLCQTKINIYKNILYAFQRHIQTCSNQRLAELYESMTKDKWDFQRIQFRVCQNLKKCSRVNLKLKNLSTNENLKNIFFYFLKNSNELWLDGSKIVDKKKIEESIQIILKAKELNMLSDNISFYKKNSK